MRRQTVFVAMLLTVAACGAGEVVDSTTSESTTSTTAAPIPGGETTTTTPSTTAATSSTTSSTSTSTTTVATLPPPPQLADGRPETFLGVTNNYVAVEVETATGDILTSFGQAATAAELAAEGEIAPNVVDGVWRTIDGEFTIVSECCEPAGGRIFYLAPGEQRTDDNVDSLLQSDGWTVAPSPGTPDVAVLGYFLRLGPVGATDIAYGDSSAASFAMSSPAWRRDLGGIYWLSQSVEDSNVSLTSIDIADGTVVSEELTWIGERWIEGLTTQASGNLVAFLHDGFDEGDDVTGVVFTPSGGVVAEFPVEPGSRLGGYDATGTYLIYVDGDGAVRWQGVGESGVLAEGYVFASW